MDEKSNRRTGQAKVSEAERLCEKYSITQPPDLSQGIASRRWLEISRLLHCLVIFPGEVKNGKPFRPILRTATTIISAPRGLLYLQDEMNERLRVGAETGFRGAVPAGYRWGNRMVNATMRCRKPLIVNEPNEVAVRRELNVGGHPCSLTVPILRQGSAWSVIQLLRSDPFLHEEAIILWVCALILEELLPALAESTRLPEGRERMGGRAGLVDPAYFNSRLEWEIERSELSGSPISLIRVGWWPPSTETVQGSNGLRQRSVLWAIRRSLRPIDLVSSWADEDLLIALPNLDSEQVKHVCQEIRRNLIQSRALGEERVVIPRLRLACCTYPTHGRRRQELIQGLEQSIVQPSDGPSEPNSGAEN